MSLPFTHASTPSTKSHHLPEPLWSYNASQRSPSPSSTTNTASDAGLKDYDSGTTRVHTEPPLTLPPTSLSGLRLTAPQVANDTNDGQFSYPKPLVPRLGSDYGSWSNLPLNAPSQNLKGTSSDQPGSIYSSLPRWNGVPSSASKLTFDMNTSMKPKTKRKRRNFSNVEKQRIKSIRRVGACHECREKKRRV